jgi:hypothetical protein
VSLESTTKIRPWVPVVPRMSVSLLTDEILHQSDVHTRVVVSPQRADLVLSTNIPDVEFDVLVGDALNVETDSRNGSDILIREL